MRQLHKNTIFTALLLGFGGAFLVGCSTPAPLKSESAAEPIVVGRELRREAAVKHSPPLPVQTVVKMREVFNDGRRQDRPAYAEYDFNRDGTPEMVVKLDEKGLPEVYAYDFNLDGKVDAIQNASQKPK